MKSKNKDSDQQGGPGIRFGVDTTNNAYAGEVGYDGGQEDYDTEIGVNDDEVEDQGRMSASHPSTLMRQMVRVTIFSLSFSFLPRVLSSIFI
jgi:hypothetical protein